MSATPIAADHSEEFEQLAGLSALRVLDGDDQERFERHAAQCERCRLIVRSDRETLGNLSLAAPEMEPSPDFKRRLMDRAAAELEGLSAAPGQGPAGQAATGQAAIGQGATGQGATGQGAAAPAPAGQEAAGQSPVAQTPAGQESVGRAPADAASADISSIETVPGDAEPESETETPGEPIQLRPRPANVVPFWRRQMWATSIAALLVLGLFSYAGYTAFMNQVVATYTTGAGPASMSVVVRRSGQTELQMQGVADPPPGFVYEAWVIPPGKQPVAAGVTPSGEATLPLPSGVQGSTIAVTLERGPTGASAPTSPPLLAVVVA